MKTGWTILTAINVMLFTILHFPCATTLLTIKKETGSWKYGAFSIIYNTAVAWIAAFIVYQVGIFIS